MRNLEKQYNNLLKQNDWTEDAFQVKALEALQRLLTDLKPQKSFWPFKKQKPVQGVYLYGGVGRGKSMLMDLFFDHVPDTVKKRRIHFHEFMIETHDWLHDNRGKGMDDLLPRYAADVAKNIKLLCFDEFHVTYVADAMILGRLFTALFDHGVVVVATSNWAPDNLYEGGLTRDRFLPFIQLLKQQSQIIHLDSDTDYRQISDPSQDVYYFTPLSENTKKHINLLFREFSDGASLTQHTLSVKGRKIYIEAAGDVARFTFVNICEKAYGAEDYIAIAQAYDTVFITDIPSLTQEKRNEAKRLILLIDCLYEAKCRLVISAESALDNLYQGDDHAFEFDRTISRLMEMQSVAYHEEREKK
jgi:cell division protein ZapE